MATCTKCGRWAGIGRHEHDVDCVPKFSEQTEHDIFIEKLTPVLKSAANRAGVVAAFTFLGICVAATVFIAILRAVLASM